jgi:hypothetical protein
MKANSTSRRNWLFITKKIFSIVSVKEEDILEAYITCHMPPSLPLSYRLISPQVYLQKLTFQPGKKRRQHSKSSFVQKSCKELQCHSYPGIVNPWMGGGEE